MFWVWFHSIILSFPLSPWGGNISKGLLEVSGVCDVFQGCSHSLSIVKQVLDIVFAWAYFETHGISLSGEGGAY
jgi:hypothetical protein